MEPITIRVKPHAIGTPSRAHRAAFVDERRWCIVDDLNNRRRVISLLAEHETNIVGMCVHRSRAVRALTCRRSVSIPTSTPRIGYALVEADWNGRGQTSAAIFVLGSPHITAVRVSAWPAEGYTAPYWGWSFMARILDDSVSHVGQVTFPAAFAEDIAQFPALLESLKSP